MKKDTIAQLVMLLPGRDAQIGLQLLQNKQFENLKDIVDADIKQFEKIEDQTGEIEKRLAKLYQLSDGLNDYIIIFDDTEYEEL